MPAMRSIDLSRVLRALAALPGASGVEGRARQEALDLIERDALVQPAFSYRILPVRELRGETIDLGDATLRVAELAAESGELTAVAAATCTLGGALGARVTALFRAHRPLLAVALDAVGNELLFRVADRTFARIRREARRQELETGAELHPGDSGIALDQQSTLLALAGAEPNTIALTAHGMLAPVKSLSFLATLGRNLSGRSSRRCDHCPSKDRCRILAH